MKKLFVLVTLLVGFLALVLAGALSPTKAFAQELGVSAESRFQDPGQRLVNISFESEDVRDALRKMFRSADIAYSIAVEIQGTVTVDFRNVPFNRALTTLLSQVYGTYQVEGGVYQVVPHRDHTILKPDLQQPPDLGSENKDEPAAMTQDVRYLYILRGDMLYKVNKVDLKTVEMRKLGE